MLCNSHPVHQIHHRSAKTLIVWVARSSSFSRRNLRWYTTHLVVFVHHNPRHCHGFGCCSLEPLRATRTSIIHRAAHIPLLIASHERSHHHANPPSRAEHVHFSHELQKRKHRPINNSHNKHISHREYVFMTSMLRLISSKKNRRI